MTPQPRARYGVLAALSLLYFLLMAFTFNSLGQVLPFMVADLGMSWAAAGFGFTLLGVACGAASLAPAYLIRRVGVPATLGTGAALLLLGFGALALTRTVPAYHAGAVLLGLGYCFCGTVPAVHIVSGLFERRSTALGIYFTSGNMGAVAGPIIFYAVSEAVGGWRAYWWLCAAATLAVGLVAAAATRGRGGDAPAGDGAPVEATGWSARRVLVTPQYWVIVSAYTACLLVNTTVHSFAFQHLMEHGETKGTATALMSIAALVGAGAAAAAGILGERIASRSLTMIALAALTVCSLSLAMSGQTAAAPAFAISMGVGLGASTVSTAVLLHDYFGRRASLEIYSIMTAVSTSAALGPGLGGIVRDRSGSFDGVWLALAAINALMLLLVLAMRRPSPIAAPAAAEAIVRS